jgi:hypothetical protein
MPALFIRVRFNRRPGSEGRELELWNSGKVEYWVIDCLTTFLKDG